MIDNYDSFTYNIVQYCLELGADLKVVRNDEVTIREIKKFRPRKGLITPRALLLPRSRSNSKRVLENLKNR